MSLDREVRAQYEQRAEDGDGMYAIALALHSLVHAVNEISFGNTATGKGAIEGGFMMLSDAINEAARTIADGMEDSSK